MFSYANMHCPLAAFVLDCCACYSCVTYEYNTQPFYGSLDFVWDNPVEPVPEETFTH